MEAPFGPLLLLAIFILRFPSAFCQLEFVHPVAPEEGVVQVRVHVGAEKGLRVVTVKALDRDAPSAQVQYKLLEDGGGAFEIDSRSGDLCTNRQLKDVHPDDVIKLLVVAAGDGQTTSLELEAYVTEFNAHAPVFDKGSYVAEVSEDLRVGSTIARVHATDQDLTNYNGNVTYRLEEETGEVGAWVRVDEGTGNVLVRKKLDAARVPWMEVHVVAEDEGSPPRAAKTKLDISVKILTAPRDVRWENSTASTSRICWSRPERGSVVGYLVRYRDADRTKEQVHTFNVTSSEHSLANNTRQMTTDGSRKARHEEQCVRLEGLRGGTHYEFRVYGWNEQEVGLGSQLFVLSTKANPCESKICGQHGTCLETSSEPWFRCECSEGYEGITCSQVDPCAASPCLNLGTCSRTLQPPSSSTSAASSPLAASSSSGHGRTCSCLPGFYGEDCGQLDPCAVGVAVCRNGGTCRSDSSHAYTCFCAVGYYGAACERRDPCAAGVRPPCGQNAVSCRNVSDTEFTCECMPGFTGNRCEKNVDECASNPCKNGAKCSDRRNGFSCTCPTGFKGIQCEEDINECEMNPCDNGGTCTDGPGHYSCNCAPGFLGPTCRENINECSSNPCLNGGTCIDGPGGFVCRCTPSFRGIICNMQNFCPESEVTTDRGSFKFNVTLPGKHAEAPCPYGSVKGAEEGGVATRQCLLFVFDSPVVRWDKVEDSVCRHKGMGEVDAITDQLQMMTSNGSMLNVDQVHKTTEDLEGVIEYATSDRTVASGVVKVISNVLEADVASFGEVEAENSIHKRLSHLVRRIADETALEPGEKFTLSTRNVIVTTQTASDLEDEVSFTGFAGRNSTMDVPVEAVHKALGNDGAAKVQFIAYSNSKLFREAHEETALSRYTPTNRQVFDIGFGNVTIKNLSSRVHFSVTKHFHGIWMCVFWDESGGFWSTKGMFTNQTEDATFCQSDHMTAFSILLDPNPNDKLSADQERALSIISYIGSGLSVICLVLTIITYSLFKTLNRDRAGKLLLNLCASLLMLNLSFLAGALRSSEARSSGTDYLCVTIAILTHYFLLTSFGWMCVEATHMYQLLVYVFATGETRFLIKRLLIAWGVPFVVVGATAAIHISSYSATDESCMLSPVNSYVYYIAFLGPMCLLMVVNIVVFAMVARILFQPHMASKVPIVPAKGAWGQRPPRVTWAQIRGAFTVMTLLGVAWVFGAFAVGPARVLFQYIFCILNSLQGALIFFVRCIHYPEARSAWMHLWRTGQRKRTRGTPSAHLVNTSSTASTFTSGGAPGQQNTARSKIMSCVTHFRKGSKRANKAPQQPLPDNDHVATESEEKAEEKGTVSSDSGQAPKAWVYGGPTEVAACEGTFMATLRHAPQTQKRRPSSPGSERLNLKEGRDTGWQYLDLQPEGILFIEDTDEEDSVAVAASAAEGKDPGPRGTGVSKISDQGYFSANSSPKANLKSENTVVSDASEESPSQENP